MVQYWSVKKIFCKHHTVTITCRYLPVILCLMIFCLFSLLLLLLLVFVYFCWIYKLIINIIFSSMPIIPHITLLHHYFFNISIICRGCSIWVFFLEKWKINNGSRKTMVINFPTRSFSIDLDKKRSTGEIMSPKKAIREIIAIEKDLGAVNDRYLI